MQSRSRFLRGLPLLCAISTIACSESGTASVDASAANDTSAATDEGAPDAVALDSGALDSGAADTNSVDTGAADTGAADVSPIDTGIADALRDDAPADDAPADVVPADVAPADVAPADVAPADVAPADVVPADVVPADVVPADVAVDAPPDVAPDVPPDVPACPAGQSMCGDRCVDRMTDTANCGACGVACGPVANAAPTCVAGACAFTCTMGFGDCDGDRADGCEVELAAAAANCGACGRTCAAGQLCRAAACATPRVAAFVFSPGAGRLHAYSPASNALRLSLDTGSAAPIALAPLAFTGEGVLSGSVAQAGVLRIEGDAPFVAWVHDASSTDHIEAAGTVDGAPCGYELLTWAGSAVTVLSGPEAPTTVRLQRLVEGAPSVDAGTWTAPGAGQHHVFPVTVAAVYRVTSTGAAVTAFGQSLAETYNHFAYVPADGGGFAGTSFRYAEPAGAAGARRMVVQSLAEAANVTFTFGGADTARAIATPVTATIVTFPADALITATASTPSIAWVEADPNNGCDGTLADADFVPSIRGRAFDTEFTFRTNLAVSGCYLERRPDVDVIGYADGTSVEAYAAGAADPFVRARVDRGRRLRVLSDAEANRYVRVVTSSPALVELSHDGFDFLVRAPSITTYE